jgi:phosphoglycerol transferase MdoB-like AlkP superfamily enzyme
MTSNSDKFSSRRIGQGCIRVLRGRWLGPYRVPLLIVMVVIAIFSLLRLGLLWAYADSATWRIGTVARVFWLGFRFDLLIGLCFVLPQSVHLLAVPSHRLFRPISSWLLEIEWLLAALSLPLIVVVECLFFDEFQSRLNYIAFEYLVYPTEVCCNIWESYAVVPYLSLVIALGGLMFIMSRQSLRRWIGVPSSRPHRAAVFAGLLAAIAGLLATTDKNSCNRCGDRVAVECACNGPYSFVYYAWTCRFDFDQNYFMVSEPEASTRVRQHVIQPADQPLQGALNPVDRIVVTGKPQRDWNVVLILEESFGSDFVGSLGDSRGLTPEFDKLTQQGLLFDQFYATGNRTARALEAVLTSMPPIPTESILKREHSDRVFTLANVLAERGYERLFMTAGRGLFDGVRRFMLANGFNHFREQSDYRNPLFVNAWGVSDEDLFREALREMDCLHAKGKPFFVTLLTVSNHRPFTFPKGRIPADESTRENVVRYADWALGQFFREAAAHDFHRHTLFVVMGDHGARVYGSQMFPIKSYRVPVLMIAPEDVEPGSRCHTLACSLDIAPTIMGLLGGEYRSVFFGHDARTIPAAAGRAVMQHNHDVVWLDTRNQLALLGFGHRTELWQLDPATWKLRRAPLRDLEPLKNTAAMFQTAHRLYYSDGWFPDLAQATRHSSRTTVLAREFQDVTTHR